MKIENKYGVAVGQEWLSCDKRETRRVRVLSVGESHAVVESMAKVKAKIRLDRFKPTATGWRLVPGD